MYRIHIFIPASEVGKGNAIAKSIFPDTKEDQTFGSVQLRTLGSLSNTATHYACNGLITDTQRVNLLKALTNPGIQGVYYRINLQTGVLEATNSSTAIIGQSWNWEKSLLDMKLEAIVQAFP